MSKTTSSAATAADAVVMNANLDTNLTFHFVGSFASI